MQTTEIDYEAEIERILNKGLVEPSTLVIGVGGGATNIVSHLHEKGLDRGTIVAINTDEKSLLEAPVDKRVLIGKVITEGNDAGGFPEVAEKCADIARDALEALLSETDIAFIIVCLGGGTGTGTAPLITEIAAEHGKIVVCIAITPFATENRSDTSNALARIKEHAKTTIVLDNNKLMDVCPDIPFNQAFNVLNNLVYKTIKSVTESIDRKYLLNMVKEETASIVRDVNSITTEESPVYVSTENLHALYASRFRPMGDTRHITPPMPMQPPSPPFGGPGMDSPDNPFFH